MVFDPWNTKKKGENVRPICYSFLHGTIAYEDVVMQISKGGHDGGAAVRRDVFKRPQV